jgi:MFS family permease
LFLFSAFTYATGALGPVVGYALGALLLQFYVDVFSYKVDLSPAHPRWIGAWWGGFIICGVVLFCIAVPFLMFPQVLVEEKRKVLESKAREDLLSPSTAEGQTNSEDYGKDAKGR